MILKYFFFQSFFLIFFTLHIFFKLIGFVGSLTPVSDCFVAFGRVCLNNPKDYLVAVEEDKGRFVVVIGYFGAFTIGSFNCC